MVAREAMAYGRPVVATAVGGLVDAVEDGSPGSSFRRAIRAPCARRSSGCSRTPRFGSASAPKRGDELAERFSLEAAAAAGSGPLLELVGEKVRLGCMGVPGAVSVPDARRAPLASDREAACCRE